MITTGEIRQSGYFDALDYGDRARASAIPRREAELLTHTDALIAALSGPARDDAALALTYVAMFMVNANYGVRDGQVNPQVLAPGQPWPVALRERNQRIIALLQRAYDAAPANRMIEGFLAGAQVRQSAALGQPVDLEPIIRLAERDSTFNLFSAQILVRDYAPTPGQRLRLERLTDQLTSANGPCSKPENQLICAPSPPLAPRSGLGASVILGDHYAARAAAEVSAGLNGAADAGKAFAIFLSAKGKPGAAVWPEKRALSYGVDRAMALFRGEITPTKNDDAALRCAACHSSRTVTTLSDAWDRSDTFWP